MVTNPASLAAVLLALVGGAYYAMESAKSDLAEMATAQQTQISDTVRQRLDALQSCYSQTRAWCSDADLASKFNLPETSPFIIERNEIGGNLEMKVKAQSSAVAAQLAKYLPEPTVDGDTISFVVKPPTHSQILLDQVQRFDDPVAQRNRLEHALYMENNDVSNIATANAKTAKFSSIEADEHKTKRLSVTERLYLGENEIAFAGNAIGIGATKSHVGTINAQQNLNMNNRNISGIATVTSDDVEANSALIDSATVNNARGDSISYTNAKIDNLTSYKYTSEQFSSNQLRVGQGNAEQTVVTNATLSTASIDDLSFDNAQGQDWSYDNANANRLEATQSQLGQASGNSLQLAGQLQSGQVVASAGQFNSVNVSSMNAGYYRNATDFSNGSTSVNQNHSAAKKNQQDAGSNTTKINANKSGIGSAESDNQQNVNTMNSNKSRIDSNRNTINSNSNKAIQNERDIDRVESRLNSSEAELGKWKTRLDKCMYSTQYCFPQTPDADVTCSNCNVNSSRQSFSSTIYGSVGDCRQGCSYYWQTSGSGLNFSNCSSGSVSKGGSASPSCRVSASVGSGQTKSGSAKLVVKNSHYTNRSRTAQQSISYENTTSDVNMNDVKGGCVWQPSSRQTTDGSCHTSGGDPNQLFWVIFSVGEYIEREYKFRNRDEWTVTWAGDCSDTGNLCQINHRNSGGGRTYTTTANIRHKTTGKTKSITLVASFNSLSSDGF